MRCGVFAARGQPSTRTRSQWLRTVARRARCGSHRRSDGDVESTRQFSANAIVGLSSGFFCVALVALALLHSTDRGRPLPDSYRRDLGLDARYLEHVPPTLPARWVRARGLSIYQMVLFGAQGLGALLWGVLADAFGLTVAFVAAAAALAVGTASIRTLATVRDVPAWTAHSWFAPNRSSTSKPTRIAGRVVVRTTYSIPTENERDFVRPCPSA